MESKTAQLGAVAERYASDFLKSRDYGILSKNYRKPWGVIDIIAEKDGVVVFVEVKANHKEIIGFEPELRVNKEKIKRILRAARTFIAEKRYNPEPEWQVDIVAITIDKDRKVAKIKHFKNIEV